MNKLQFWIYCLYLAPLYISALYFTILKIEDRNREEKIYSEDKLPFKKVIVLCFIPVLNMMFMGCVIGSCLKSIKK